MTYQWIREDYEALAAGAATLNMRAADLLLVLYAESRLNPAAKNPAGAYGLNQLTRAAGFTQAELDRVITLTPREQVPLIVRYFQATGLRSYSDAGAIYAFNFAPSIARNRGTADNVVLYSTASGAAYELNKSLDRDKDGDIEVGELRQLLRPLAAQSGFQQAMLAFKTAVPSVTDPVVGTTAIPTPNPPATPPPPPVSTPGKYLYRVVDLALAARSTEIEAQLTEFDLAGWELCGGGDHRLILRRPR